VRTGDGGPDLSNPRRCVWVSGGSGEDVGIRPDLALGRLGLELTGWQLGWVSVFLDCFVFLGFGGGFGVMTQFFLLKT
jgi:hypothetical protein